jgi:hypothetical protein
MKQMIIRTANENSYSIDSINKYLSNGWVVLMVNPIGKYLEYVLQKPKDK